MRLLETAAVRWAVAAASAASAASAAAEKHAPASSRALRFYMFPMQFQVHISSRHSVASDRGGPRVFLMRTALALFVFHSPA